MAIIKNLIYCGAEGRKSVLDLFLTETGSPKPLVVFCHGYKGFKDWGAWNKMGEYFANQGLNFLKFNFSHNGGTIEQPIDFPDLDAFGRNRYSYELEDINKVIEWINNFEDPRFKNVLRNEIYLMGHSRGGAISVLKAGNDPRIKKLITLAAVCDFKNRSVFGGDIENWKKTNVRYALNGRTKQNMPHYYSFLEDFQENEEKLTIQNAAKKIQIPYLILHGETDESIFVKEAENLKKWCPEAKLVLIPNASHTFNTKHPHSDPMPMEFQEVLENCISFLKE